MRDHLSAEITLLHVSGHDVPEVAHGAFAGLLGRGHPERDPGDAVEQLATTSGTDLPAAAAARLGRPCVRAGTGWTGRAGGRRGRRGRRAARAGARR
ncbi:hypothetical protein [Lentzea guizhouensis]|uniref:hypothetical protein n=1 Tax=Lentzea guizhouensis TaxID=1586287 RepID=UPI000B0847A5|nr:hypothetical protein [Lentzea guizhouensis]